MPRQRRTKSLLVWEPFLLGVVLVCALAASLTARLGATAVIVGVLAALIAIPAVVQLVRLGLREGGGRNSSRLLASVSDFELVGAPTQGVLFLDGTKQRQDSIDLALGWTGGESRVVLWPRATNWFGRELRVEAYLLDGDHPARAGFLPRAADASDALALEALLDRGILVTVPAVIRGAGKLVDPARPFTRLERPFTVEVGRPQLDQIVGRTA
jgi:hypothetical protein